MLPELGIVAPTAIQEAAVPRILARESLIIQSSTGSGKVRRRLCLHAHLGRAVTGQLQLFERTRQHCAPRRRSRSCCQC